MSEPLTPAEPVPDDFIVSEDPLRPTADLVATIRDRLAVRPVEESTTLPPFPPFGGRPEAARDSSFVARHLALAADLLAEMETTPVLAPSPATELPVIGRLWGLVREQAHNLVLFYVNRQAAQTARVQYHLLAALQALAAESERMHATPKAHETASGDNQV